MIQYASIPLYMLLHYASKKYKNIEEKLTQLKKNNIKIIIYNRKYKKMLAMVQ